MSQTDKIVVVENLVQAQMLDAILTERKIPHIMRTYHDSAYDGLFQNQKGWGHVEAPEEFREEIVSIYEELESDSSAD